MADDVVVAQERETLESRFTKFKTDMEKRRRTELEFLRSYAAKGEILEDKSIFSTFLNFLCSVGISQTEISKEVGTNAATVSRWANGMSHPPSYARLVVMDKVRDILETHAAAR